jgi:FKBP-type peptidyl-prolyl cis-trans isomerase FkpA
MRTRTITSFFLAVASIALITSCGHSGFQTDSKTGVVYQFIKHDESGVKGTDSDIAKLVLAYSTKTKSGKDSDLFNSRKRGGDSTGVIPLRLQKTFNGCLEQGILMMSPGDSALFQINADSLYLKFFHAPADKLPPGVHGSTYTFRISLKSFMTKKDMQDEQNKQRQKMMEQIMARKSMEAPAIAAYLAKNHYENVKPGADSIFILEDKKGKSREVKEGDSLEVGYTGRLLNDTIFDFSDKGPGHRTYKLLYTKNAALIKGWISVLGNMHEMEKVKVLIPSAMAYGPRGGGPIPPFSPLVFDIEVVSIKSNK